MYSLWNPKLKLLIKIIFFVIVFIRNNVAGNFIPEGRAGQEAILIGTQLYFMGGSRTIPSSNPIKSNIRSYNLSDEVFFLDLSNTFSTNNPPFVDLSDAGARMKFGNEKGSAVFGGPNQEVYLVGGTQQNLALLNKDDQNITITSNQTLMIEEIFNTYNATDQMIFRYRPASRNWSPFGQGVSGTQPTRRRSTSTVIDQKGIIYIFGGRIEFDMFSHTLILYNELYTFDTTLTKWDKIDAVNAPSARSHTTPILLPSGKILYIGGVTQSAPGITTNLLPMTEIPVFDTISSTWSSKTTSTSFLVQPRVGHTATLAPDNKTIIIIGGTTSYQLNQTIPIPNYLILNVATEPYQYSELKSSGNQPPPLSFHTSTLYRNYIIVAFGNITNDALPSYETSPNIYLLDVNCFAWVNSFSSGNSSCPTPLPSPSSTPGPNTGLAISIILAGF
ncbi:galactose oxidase [Gigaspora margarita]|uniref:Galactose oxidase n=1 Tax=Gigaspora margarita TaxID=4874 RepID=A0A8H3XIA0_GIGMA|nr:galactose oxidase [Gigaspora margarita]